MWIILICSSGKGCIDECLLKLGIQIIASTVLYHGMIYFPCFNFQCFQYSISPSYKHCLLWMVKYGFSKLQYKAESQFQNNLKIKWNFILKLVSVFFTYLRVICSSLLIQHLSHLPSKKNVGRCFTQGLHYVLECLIYFPLVLCAFSQPRIMLVLLLLGSNTVSLSLPYVCL